MHELHEAANTGDSRPATGSWRRELAAAVRDPGTLLRALGLSPAGALPEAGFPLLVTRSFLARMRPGDAADPLLRQVLPVADEDRDVPGFGPDPVGDASARAAPGVLRKYAGRALVIAAPVCAIHCRYCFRRHFPYDDEPQGDAARESACAEVAADPTVSEVILSGGDPLMLTDAALHRWTERLAAIPHVRRLRIHTRLPIVLPARVDDGLLAWLAATRAAGLAPWLVVHANHPAEVVGDCAAALARLVSAGVPVLNQSVLLAGVNDDADTLALLCERLIDLGVRPYYLHQLDRVAGAAHFHVDERRGRALADEVRRRLPGYAVPRYVREIAGEPSKVDVV